jgi:hypothetical protein
MDNKDLVEKIKNMRLKKNKQNRDSYQRTKLLKLKPDVKKQVGRPIKEITNDDVNKMKDKMKAKNKIGKTQKIKSNTRQGLRPTGALKLPA